METHMENNKMLYSHVSVDCVLLGVNEDKLCVLLIERQMDNSDEKRYKLPGSLIFENEDLDTAAHRVFNEATGFETRSFKTIPQFWLSLAYKNKDDMQWLENAMKLKIERIVTVAYLALSKIGRKSNPTNKYNSLAWFPVDALPSLPFDHKEIIEAAVEEIREWVEKEPSIIFDYLPLKFTAYQLRRTYEIIYNKEMDVRNFHKKMGSLEYIVQTDEIETGVAHHCRPLLSFRQSEV